MIRAAGAMRQNSERLVHEFSRMLGAEDPKI